MAAEDKYGDPIFCAFRCGAALPLEEMRTHHCAAMDKGTTADVVNQPSHYTSHPSGIECIQVTESMPFCLGSAVKYIWRADLKHNDGGIQDLRKAEYYIRREIDRRTRLANTN